LICAVLKRFLRRVRRLMMADVLAEIAALRQEMAAHDAKIEAALLTIALSRSVDDEARKGGVSNDS
jgi:hypothetical protein